MMKTDLATQNSDAMLPDIVNPYEDQYDALASAGGFLPRMQLFISNSTAVKDEKVPMNHYGLVTGREDIDILGREVDALIICWRPRALDTSDKANIRASSQMKSELFLDIQEKAGETNSGCLYGPEFLLWIPSREKFATILFGSKSARNEARNVHQYVKKPCTFKSRKASNTEYSWQVMLVTQCSTPFDYPSQEAILEVSQEFLNPKEITGAEKVETEIKRDR